MVSVALLAAAACWIGSSPTLQLPPHPRPSFHPRTPRPSCCAPDQPSHPSLSPFALFVGLAIAGELLPVFLTVLGRLGLFTPPPLNLFTSVANNAMEAAVHEGTVYPLLATAYAQGVWVDLIRQYYDGGESMEFLRQVCAEHARWCAGVTIP
ncbi:hypothetical protein AB1Y20_000212 [Prymnesium parvum]|uniref:Uncharacterized protein n=1 Tax=Prymnesium parvum TaxID=97485 RepID=A0AB34K7V0_PRYPA